MVPKPKNAAPSQKCPAMHPTAKTANPITPSQPRACLTSPPYGLLMAISGLRSMSRLNSGICRILGLGVEVVNQMGGMPRRKEGHFPHFQPAAGKAEARWRASCQCPGCGLLYRQKHAACGKSGRNPASMKAVG